MTQRPIGVKTILLAVAAIIAMTLSGCGDEAPTQAADEGPAGLSVDDLDGRVFATAQVDGHALVDETVVRLAFDGDELSVDAGCNHLTGTVAVEGDRLDVSNLGGTEIGCTKDRAAQDEWIADFLTHSPTVALDDGTLTLTGGDVVMALAAQTVPDEPTGDPEQPTSNVTTEGG